MRHSKIIIVALSCLLAITTASTLLLAINRVEANSASVKVVSPPSVQPVPTLPKAEPQNPTAKSSPAQNGFVDLTSREELLKESEQATKELYRRHQRIVELQTEIERLGQERIDAKELAASAEQLMRDQYESELRIERAKRKKLEEQLKDLDAIRQERVRLSKFVRQLEIELSRDAKQE